MTVKLDVSRVIDDLGGPAQVVDLLQKVGVNMTIGAVCNMKARGNIRMQTWLALVSACRAAGRKELKLNSYLVESAI